MSDSPAFPVVDYATWRQRVERELGEADFAATLTTQLPEGIATQPLYMEHVRTVRQPRRAATGELGWSLCPRFESAEPGVTNRQIMAELDGGASALWIRLDLAARTGVDADDSAAPSLGGQDGVAAQHLPDFDVLLSGVELGAVPTLIDAGANALPLAATVLALLEQRNLDRSFVELHLNCDPLAALAHDGRLPASLEDLATELCQLTSFCHASLPAATAVTVSDLPYHGAGATAADELGIAAATLICYLRWIERGGWDPARALPHILLRTAVDRDLFVGVAKLRALRLLWSKIATACGIEDPPPARIHAVTSERPLTSREAWVNMLRITTQTLAAVVGGADLVTTAAWDRPLGESTAAARRLARNTQSILGFESQLGRVLDPAGGAHYIEELTDQLARRGWQMMQEIETAGGAEKALTSGWLAERLDQRRATRRTALADGSFSIIGVTEFVAEDALGRLRELLKRRGAQERAPERIAADPGTTAKRAARRLRDYLESRRPSAAPAATAEPPGLDGVTQAAAEGATLGEISTALGRAPGETLTPLPAYRDSEAYE
ncbi:MAG: methylmalonyl-CoA mutase family protein [Acidobacteria bacterium]|nr:methylmalonyl-CoA mutase family protein [Acidobacteriota bacterium]